MIWLSDDHTGGPVSARSNVASGDLAVGKIVETISHSQYWKDSAIFVVEDDSQNGADHVDGHRAPVQVISPWATHGQTVSRYYTQMNMVRTIEQILGAEPGSTPRPTAARRPRHRPPRTPTTPTSRRGRSGPASST
ncbi:alkaline phosphatase family protein [Nocardioides mesophilus]|uniref:alkaline phosphatase family protein n=1 Tax=Nocardioides mesophilus TaxID=433659 RepID=UPI001FE44B68|nr:alkaline phosphatase family protein [Nocardioides mesophilus]